jgi:hypothetical protein
MKWLGFLSFGNPHILVRRIEILRYMAFSPVSSGHLAVLEGFCPEDSWRAAPFSEGIYSVDSQMKGLRTTLGVRLLKLAGQQIAPPGLDRV